MSTLNSPICRQFTLLLFLGFAGVGLTACSLLKGKSLTLYQVPAAVLEGFKELHPLAHDPEFIEAYKKGVRVYLVRYTEGEEEHDLTLNAYGKPILPKVKPEEGVKAEEPKDEEAAAATKEAEKTEAQDPKTPPAAPNHVTPAKAPSPAPSQ